MHSHCGSAQVLDTSIRSESNNAFTFKACKRTDAPGEFFSYALKPYLDGINHEFQEAYFPRML